MNYLVFDIETKNWIKDRSGRIQHSQLGISVLGAYVSWTQEYIAFLEKDVPAFNELLPQADLVIGYNSIGFDYPVLQAYSDLDLNSLPSYDIMLAIESKIGHKVKLGDVAYSTLGYDKTDKGSNAVKYYQEGVWDKLIDYCMHDVKITQEIFAKIRQDGLISYRDLLDHKNCQLEPPEVPKKELKYFQKGIF